MSRFGSGLAPGEDDIPWAITGFGAVLLVAFVVETTYFSGLEPGILFTGGMAVNTLMAAPFFLAVIYGGIFLKRSSVGPERYRRAGLWCLGGAGAFFALNLAGVAAWTPDRLWFLTGWLRNTTTMGAAIGLLIGVIEAQAIEGAIAAERSRLEAENLENRREWLDYLNGLLRHEVLNNSQVISGYTSILMREHDLDEDVEERLRAIRRQSEDMTRITEDVRVLIEATRGEDRLRPIDLGGVLADEVADLRETYGDVDVEADLPESVHVRADEMVRRVFSNLLSNAVEHNDGDGARIDVDVEASPETATVRIADDGPGVPDSIRESLFQRSRRRAGENGLGLHLVEQLVERYDGEVELVESGEDGSVFAVRLPRVDGADEPTATAVAAPSDDAPVRTNPSGRSSPAE